MIILDLNQVMIANMMASVHSSHGMEINEDMLRHMILNSIRMNKTKFSSEYGELVIACDDKDNWRKKYFPYYKASRKKARQESTLDWNEVFTVLNKIRSELREFFPYRVIQIEHAEADDVIATLCKQFGKQLVSSSDNKILILSGDKDFVQLQKYANVEQYDPTRKKWIRNDEPRRFLFEHILQGDASDGIPNVLSPDDVFVTASRQKPLTSKKKTVWVDELVSGREPAEIFDENQLRNYRRNERLIDLEDIPQDISGQIMEVYELQEGKTRSCLFDYFIKHKLKNLMENITEF